MDQREDGPSQCGPLGCGGHLFSARLAIAVCASVDAPDQDAGRLLEIARMYTTSEEVAGSALVAVLTGGDRVRLTEAQVVQFHELIDDFVARYPESDILRAYSAERPEELLEMMVASLRSRAEHYGDLVNEVRYGRLPYGALLWVRSDLPYTDVLLSVAADWLTAISPDRNQRGRETQAAVAALGGRVAADTSVAALGIASDLDILRLGTAFGSVLVGDELIVDARWAVLGTRRPVAAVAGYDPVLGEPTMTEIDERQQQARVAKAESALEILSSWQSFISGPLPSLPRLEEEGFRPWDASLRVAASAEVALWCDDIALRALAEAQGIPTFGTWALYEALSSTPEGTWMPTATELKMQLLRAKIADVPISLRDLGESADSSDGLDPAVGLHLSRPHVWGVNPAEPLTWYLHRVQMMIGRQHRQWIPPLLNAACRGQGAAVNATHRPTAIGAVLAATLPAVGDPHTVPALLAASRYAANELDPADWPDPLPATVRHLLRILEPTIGPGPTTQTLVQMFACTEPRDRLTVTSIILEDR